VNLLAAVLFLLLLAVHLYMGSKWQEWQNHFELFWQYVDVYAVRPPLGFCTGYALMFGLFYLLRGQIDINNKGRRRVLRWIMSLVTGLLFLGVLYMVGITLSSQAQFGILPFNQTVYNRLYALCNANWLWALLGVYWFVSLNANRVAELPEEEDEE
jgi:hypothetical protein